MMEPFTLAWAAEAVGAALPAPQAAEIVIRNVCTDTRQEVAGSLFIALVGENSDGHRYVAQAFAKGAVAALVSQQQLQQTFEPTERQAGPLLVVPDTLFALGELAKRYRGQFDIPVVGITGSVGKTSTREMVAAILATRYRVLGGEKNYNNEIGVPLTLFQLNRAHTAAVIEMGMRGPGQIDRLAEIAQPTIGLITNIGLAHAELLGSQQAIAQAKSELYARLPSNGIALLPYDSPFYDYLCSRVPDGVRCFTFGKGGDKDWPPDVRLYPLPNGPEGTAEALAFFHRAETFFAMKAVGAHILQNAAAALSVAFALDIPVEPAARALESWEGAPGRMVLRETPEGLTILEDCYNAGPESMAAALETLKLTTVLPGVAILGDMKELGTYSEEAHRAVGRKVVEAGVRTLITVGELAPLIAREAAEYAAKAAQKGPTHFHFTDSKQAAQEIRSLLQPRDTVLIKGSRAMEMETIVAALTGETGSSAHG